MEKEKQKKLLNQIMEIVRSCGEIILHADRSKSCIDAKAGHANFVTTYDKKVQQELEKRLLEILPEAVFVGEEEDIHASITKGYAFIVDPIDGTTNFIKDYHLSAISVGLTLDGERFMGVVYNPYLNEMFTAITEQGLCNVIGVPSAVVIFPPASSTIREPAAKSHGQRRNSKNNSALPAATLHRSSAAEPLLRTSSDR